MLVKTRAIALHCMKYAESGIIAWLYTERFGRQSFIVNGVRTKKPAVPASFFLPLTLLEVDMYYKPGKDIQRLKEVSCLLHFHSIPYNVKKSTIALFISELLYKTLKEETGNIQLFEFLFNAIQLLDLKDEGSENFHLAFLMQYMKYLGIYPFKQGLNDIDGYHQEFFLPADAGPNEREGLELFICASLTQLDKIKISYETRSFLLEHIIEFYLYHLDQIADIRSLQVLKEVFHRP